MIELFNEDQLRFLEFFALKFGHHNLKKIASSILLPAA